MSVGRRSSAGHPDGDPDGDPDRLPTMSTRSRLRADGLPRPEVRRRQIGQAAFPQGAGQRIALGRDRVEGDPEGQGGGVGTDQVDHLGRFVR